MIYVLYHSPCQDGFGAAYAAWKKFGDKAKYYGVSYGKPLPDMPKAKEVYILDFSYSKEILEQLANNCEKVVVLDHHKTAQKDLEGLSFAIFDMNRSGASMAWDYFHPKKKRPWFINYIEDRDLWKHKLPFTHEIASSLMSYPLDFKTWDKFNEKILLTEGKAIFRYKNILTEDLARNTRVVKFLEFDNIPVCNASGSLVSDLGEFLSNVYPDAKFYAIYYDTKEGKRKWSLRSSDDKEDVSIIAKRFNGGGHRNASGFIESIPNDLIKL